MTSPHTSIKLARGRRIALFSIAASSLLAIINVAAGLAAGSTSVLAAGVEFAGDVLASVIVLVGMRIAARPADANHPYGHGRAETLAGFVVGVILVIAGIGISYNALQRVGDVHAPPGRAATWAILTAIFVRGAMSTVKFRVGRRIGSTSLMADAWNDTVDILSAIAALIAVGLAQYDPERFLAADHYGGFAVGLIVVLTGLRVIKDASMDLLDTMPDLELTASVREVAKTIPGAIDVEKCFARRSGLQYLVDMHLEVDPNLTVAASHDIATQVRARVREELDWVADVLVHVEPADLGKDDKEKGEED